jgi:thymidylate synthase
MHLKFRNVNEAFHVLVGKLNCTDKGCACNNRFPNDVIVVRSESRNGDVITIEEPMTITYEKPAERVLFCEARDANPFFHLFESLWMLAGRTDLEPLRYYVSNFDQFSDDKETLNGAYGYRWRHAKSHSWHEYPAGESSQAGIRHVTEDIDQLKIVAQNLRDNPKCRREVVQMWNVEDDLLKVRDSADVCCNLSVMFRIREVCECGETRQHRHKQPKGTRKFLDKTLTNRSNDMIMGIHAANFVHFSFIQEYMAARIGVEIGVYNQFTNNLHVYEWNWFPDDWNQDQYGAFYTTQQPKRLQDLVKALMGEEEEERSGYPVVPLVSDPDRFDKEVQTFVSNGYGDSVEDKLSMRFDEPFLQKVATPMACAHAAHKRRDYDTATEWMDAVESPDWKLAGELWLKRRALQWASKKEKEEATA